MNTISVHELKTLIDNNEDFQLIDVREPYEVEICSLNGIEIPMNEIPGRVGEIATDKKVIVHCRSGKRSANVIDFLEQNHHLQNLYNLEGGILAWVDAIDPTMEAY